VRFGLSIAVTWGCFLLISETQASPHGTDASTGVLDELLAGDSDSAEQELRRLALRSDRGASLRLLVLSRKKDVSPQARLELVRALFAHRDSPSRKKIERALIRQLLQSPPRQAKFRDTRLSEMVRGSAALALARMADARGLRTLVSLVADKEGHDEVGRELAHNALEQFPPSDPVLANLIANSPPLERAESQVSLAKSPTALVEKLSSLTFGADAQALLEAHADADALKSMPALSDPKSWTKALRKNPAWALRCLTLLPVGQTESLKKLLQKSAEKGLADQDKNVRSAASWALAVTSPKSAHRLLKSKDPVIVAAALWQAHLAPIAQAAAKYARAHEESELGRVALHMSLWSPETWRSWSTSSLWKLSAERPRLKHFVAPLASRYRPTDPRLSLTTLSEWLNAEDSSQRSAAALGLSRNAHGSARGLLARAYRSESDPTVRRVQAEAFGNSPGLFKRVRSLASTLDHDEACRSLAVGDVKEEVHFRVELNETQRFEWTDAKGRTLIGIAAPDGFRAVVGRDL